MRASQTAGRASSQLYAAAAQGFAGQGRAAGEDAGDGRGQGLGRESTCQGSESCSPAACQALSAYTVGASGQAARASQAAQTA